MTNVADAARPGRTGRTLLLVEDDDVFRDRLARAMTRRGYDVITAASLAEGVRKASARPPAYAVVDLNLQDGSGLDVIDLLRDLRPDCHRIVLSGYADYDTAVAAVKFGATDYLAKPVTADEVEAALVAGPDGRAEAPASPLTPEEALREHIAASIRDFGGNVSETARRLQMHRRTLQRILARGDLVRGGHAEGGCRPAA